MIESPQSLLHDLGQRFALDLVLRVRVVGVIAVEAKGLPGIHCAQDFHEIASIGRGKRAFHLRWVLRIADKAKGCFGQIC